MYFNGVKAWSLAPVPLHKGANGKG